nr:MAG TPA: hypothetical protein [Caudoviricetes sp.]
MLKNGSFLHMTIKNLLSPQHFKKPCFVIFLVYFYNFKALDHKSATLCFLYIFCSIFTYGC